MDRLISSSAVRLVGLGLLAVAVVLGPGEARASALASDCVELPWIACKRCFNVEWEGWICEALICVAGPTIHSKCRAP